MGRTRRSEYNPRLAWIPPPVERIETESDILPHMAPTITEAVKLCESDPCTEANFNEPWRLIRRTVALGDKPHRVFLHLTLMSDHRGKHWHALVLHPQGGDPLRELVTVGQWNALVHLATANIRIRLLELEPKLLESQISEGYQWVGPKRLPAKKSEPPRCIMPRILPPKPPTPNRKKKKQ